MILARRRILLVSFVIDWAVPTISTFCPTYFQQGSSPATFPATLAAIPLSCFGVQGSGIREPSFCSRKADVIALPF